MRPQNQNCRPRDLLAIKPILHSVRSVDPIRHALRRWLRRRRRSGWRGRVDRDRNGDERQVQVHRQRRLCGHRRSCRRRCGHRGRRAGRPMARPARGSARRLHGRRPTGLWRGRHVLRRRRLRRRLLHHRRRRWRGGHFHRERAPAQSWGPATAPAPSRKGIRRQAGNWPGAWTRRCQDALARAGLRSGRRPDIRCQRNHQHPDHNRGDPR